MKHEEGGRRKVFKQLVLPLSRLSLSIVFFLAAWPKIVDPAGFATDIENYAIVPKVLVNLMALTLPWVEFMAALALVLGTVAEFKSGSPLARGAALLCLVLLGIFIVAIASAVYRDLDITCGCFGHSGGRKAGFKALAEDGGFLILAVISLLPIRKRLNPRSARTE